MLVVSAWVERKKSRLLSWPMYFWYERGTPSSTRRIGSRSRMYQSATKAGPPGFPCTTRHTNARSNPPGPHPPPQQPPRLLIVCLRKLVDEFDQLLRAEHLVGVQPAVDPDHRLAL